VVLALGPEIEISSSKPDRLASQLTLPSSRSL